MNTVSTKDKLLKRDGKACFYCGGFMLKPTIEHLIAKSLGGSDDLSNLVLAHEGCNNDMGDLPLNIKVNRAIKCRVELIQNTNKYKS